MTLKEKFIPFKFFDNPIKKNTEVYCRGVETGIFKVFTLRNSSWAIVDPFRYPSDSDGEKIHFLQKIFETSNVFHDPCDRYMIKNYRNKTLDENNFKYISYLPNNYTTKIVMGTTKIGVCDSKNSMSETGNVMDKKRYYNLFTEEGAWTNERGSGYKNMQNHHILMKKSDDNKLYFKKIGDNQFEELTNPIWTILVDDVDMIFTQIALHDLEEMMKIKIENNIDYVYISDKWISEDGGANASLEHWYLENIASIYELSFLSSRNISDILSLETKKDWEKITEDIILSINIPLYESPKVSRFPKNYAIPGKYNNVYCYRLGDYLLKFLENSDCKETQEIWKKFSRLGKWGNIISNIFNYERLDPVDFSIPETCIYMDPEFIITRSPIISINFISSIEYCIVISEGSYITFNTITNKSKFHGLHELCKPTFMAGKRCIENFMLCSAKKFDVKLEAISNLTDKTPESLKIMVKITPSNVGKYQRVLPSYIVEQFDRDEIKEITIPMWFGETMNDFTPIFDPQVSVKTSNAYLDHLMHLLSRIK